MSEQDHGATLWCVHIIGPDDVHAAPDFDTAEAWATGQNRLMREYTVASGMENDPHWPEVRAVVAIWPWSAEDHASDLPKSIRDFTPPAKAPASPVETCPCCGALPCDWTTNPSADAIPTAGEVA